MELDIEDYVPADGRTIDRYGPWKRKFIWFAKINGQRVLMRYVWQRKDIFGMIWINSDDVWDWALNDFELLAKSERR